MWCGRSWLTDLFCIQNAGVFDRWLMGAGCVWEAWVYRCVLGGYVGGLGLTAS